AISPDWQESTRGPRRECGRCGAPRPGELGELLARQGPIDRIEIGLHLFDLRRPDDHRGNDRLSQHPGDTELANRPIPGLRERAVPLESFVILVAQPADTEVALRGASHAY